MSCEINVQDLPDEMLEKILRLLSLEDRKSALRVCKRWSALKAFDLSSVQLVVVSDKFDEDYHRALRTSVRRYKHMAINVSKTFEKHDLLEDILTHFSESVESSKLFLSNCCSEQTKKFFAKIAVLLPNLKHLSFGGEFESGWGDMKFCPMNNLEGLTTTFRMLTFIPNMQEMAPNITRLSMDIESKESLDFLQHFSSQLVELNILISSHANFLLICTMQFPLLEKASIDCSDDNVWSQDEIDRFYQRLPPGRKGIVLLCQSLKNIKFLNLSLYHGTLGQASVRAICKLKHLKRLYLYGFTIRVPRQLNCPSLESLHVLSLDTVQIDDQFHRFRQYAFPNLTVLEVLDMCIVTGVDDIVRYEEVPFELYDNVCGDMPSLKRLVLFGDESNIQLGPFLKFCASRAPRELRISCKDVLDGYPVEELHPIPVETLIMEVSRCSTFFSLESLQKLIQSMGGLKRLELSVCESTTYNIQLETIQSLREAFPRCEVVERLTIETVEFPLWFMNGDTLWIENA